MSGEAHVLGPKYTYSTEEAKGCSHHVQGCQGSSVSGGRNLHVADDNADVDDARADADEQVAYDQLSQVPG